MLANQITVLGIVKISLLPNLVIINHESREKLLVNFHFPEVLLTVTEKPSSRGRGEGRGEMHRATRKT